EQLTQAGISLAIDNFGAGCSSLGYLKRFNLLKLKIDNSFVHDLSNAEELTVAASIISVSRSLGFSAAAAGVETEQQLQQLQDMGCDYIQGYILSKPLPAEQMADFLRSHRAVPATQRSIL